MPAAIESGFLSMRACICLCVEHVCMVMEIKGPGPKCNVLPVPSCRDWESHSGGGPGYISLTAPAPGPDPPPSAHQPSGLSPEPSRELAYGEHGARQVWVNVCGCCVQSDSKPCTQLLGQQHVLGLQQPSYLSWLLRRLIPEWRNNLFLFDFLL